MFPHAYSFFPRSWDAESEGSWKDLQASFEEGKTYIIKPRDGSEGNGIVLVQRWNDLERCVAERRGSNPIIQGAYTYLGNDHLGEGTFKGTKNVAN